MTVPTASVRALTWTELVSRIEDPKRLRNVGKAVRIKGLMEWATLATKGMKYTSKSCIDGMV